MKRNAKRRRKYERKKKIRRSGRDKGINNRNKQTRGTEAGRRKQLKYMKMKR